MHICLKVAAIVSLLMLAGCGTVGRNQPGISNFDQVSPTLYRGGQPTTQGVQTLASLHVKSVINLRDDADPREEAAVRAAGMSYYKLPENAGRLTCADADHFLSLIANAPSPAFVHCYAGRDRTGLAVAAYRVRVQHWNTRTALADLYAHGHNWAFFPKIRATFLAFAAIPAPTALPPATSLTDSSPLKTP